MSRLVECPDCNGEVSRRAAICPRCGCPMGKVAANAEVALEPAAERQYTKRDMAIAGTVGCLIWPVLIAFILPFLRWVLLMSQ